MSKKKPSSQIERFLFKASAQLFSVRRTTLLQTVSEEAQHADEIADVHGVVDLLSNVAIV